jgi:myo-inositol 2-dehydrogenase/D-chiro-inositol 1-dehydrogenase
MTKATTLAVIGAGRIGRLHAEHLAHRLPEANLVAIADPRLDAAQTVAAACRVARTVADYHELLQDPSIEAVVICSATDTHAAIIADAAAAGKHIFCEKPIAQNLAAIDRALNAVAAAGVILQVGFNRRFDPNFKRVREIVAAGEIGQPHILRITSRDPAPPPLDYVKVSGGLFMDMAIHDFDMARYLMGEEVVEIYAVGGVLVDPAIGRAGDIDTAVVTLRFASGALGTIDNSRQAVYGYDQRVEVFGSAGAVSVSNNTPHSAVMSKADGVHSAKPLYFFVERYVESYLAEMRAFLESVRTGCQPPVTGNDGRVPVVMALAAGKSLAERRPVRLDEIAVSSK